MHIIILVAYSRGKTCASRMRGMSKCARDVVWARTCMGRTWGGCGASTGRTLNGARKPSVHNAGVSVMEMPKRHRGVGEWQSGKHETESAEMQAECERDQAVATQDMRMCVQQCRPEYSGKQIRHRQDVGGAWRAERHKCVMEIWPARECV